jgi:hypothetical protein
MRPLLPLSFRLLLATGLACSALPAPSARTPGAGNTGVMSAAAPAPSPVEFTFVKGDSRTGSRIQVRIEGDSLRYRVTTYSPTEAPIQTLRSVHMSGHRSVALKSVLGELPRYPAFGSCYGKDMKYYLVETPEGKFYRSLPERAGKCYSDEPGIWSLFQDLDDLMAPPSETDYQEYSSAS